MKKVGIITFHASHNCGSMMQAYALQKTLKKMNVDNEIIDFQSFGQKDMYAVVHTKKEWKSFAKNMLTLPYRKKIKLQWESYEQYKNKIFELSDKQYSTTSELTETNNLYSSFISGADQIWNITIRDYDDAYFLSFVTDNRKKNSYAPSFGAKRIEEHADNKQKYINFLNSYNNLSIRENNGKKWIKELTGRDAKLVLDPTLLLQEDDYLEAMEDIAIDKNYIFYYSPKYNKKIDELVKRIAKKYNKKVIVWNATEYYVKQERRNGFVLPEKINPGVYLYLIKHADLIITTSFHGSIFSTIYRKKFWTIKNGDMFNNDDRVITLLKQIDFEDKLIDLEFDNNKDYFEEINYTNYERKLDELKKESINYLKKCINSTGESVDNETSK